MLTRNLKKKKITKKNYILKRGVQLASSSKRKFQTTDFYQDLFYRTKKVHTIMTKTKLMMYAMEAELRHQYIIVKKQYSTFSIQRFKRNATHRYPFRFRYCIHHLKTNL